MYVLSLPPDSGEFNKLAGIDFLRTTALVSVLGRDPTTIHYDSRTINFDWVFLWKRILKWQSTPFVTVKRIDYVKPLNFLSIDYLFTRNQNLFAHVELAKKKVWLESVIDSPFFFRHTPPSEVHLFPGCAVSYTLWESVMTFTSVEILLKVFSVLKVRKGSGEDTCVNPTVPKQSSFLGRKAFDQTSCQHFIL